MAHFALADTPSPSEVLDGYWTSYGLKGFTGSYRGFRMSSDPPDADPHVVRAGVSPALTRFLLCRC
jgi:hypothetical protein